MGHNIIPACRRLTFCFSHGALAATRHISIDRFTSQIDILSILWGIRLSALQSLTIMGGSNNLLTVGERGLRRILILTIDCTTARSFFAHPGSAGTLHNLRSLTVEDVSNGLGHSGFSEPEHLLRALGPTSKLTTLAISLEGGAHCVVYHAAVLAPLAKLSQPLAAPPNMSLLRLSFRMGWHHERQGPSLVVAARKSSLAHGNTA